MYICITYIQIIYEYIRNKSGLDFPGAKILTKTKAKVSNKGNMSLKSLKLNQDEKMKMIVIGSFYGQRLLPI